MEMDAIVKHHSNTNAVLLEQMTKPQTYKQHGFVIGLYKRFGLRPIATKI